MVTFTQPTRSAFSNSRISELRLTNGLFGRITQQDNSCRAKLVVPQGTAMRFVEDDLLAFSEWFIFTRALSCERSVFESLMWPDRIEILKIRNNEMVNVLLAEYNE